MLYKKYVNSSNYLSERKSRMLKNFEVDLLGFKFLNKNPTFLDFDEGFFQKIYFNFNHIRKSKFNLKEQNNYLKLVPSPNLIVLIDTNLKTCLKRSKNRKDGFLYDKKILKKSNSKYFNKSVINFAKNRKIPIIRLKGTKNKKKNLKIFFKKIYKFKN